MAARAGLSVSELMAERIVEIAIVRANCLKKSPVTPEINAHGTKTADSTAATPITGPVTSLMALTAASRGESPAAIQRSTFSTTTIASSTTIPIESTRPKRVSVFRLNPIRAIAAKVPMIATGTAISGISAARQFWRNTSTTIATRMIASRRVLMTSEIDSVM